MRQLLITLLFTGLSLASSQAQEFLPIVKEGAVWNQWAGWGAAPDPFLQQNWSYRIEGDTVIEGKQYGKVMVEGDLLGDWSQGYHGALREDSGRVYYRPLFDTAFVNVDTVILDVYWCIFGRDYFYDELVDFGSEVIMYDFNLMVGDSFYGYEVSLVDSIVLVDGLQRKRVSLAWGEIEWIEGIGSNKGLLEGGCLQFENAYGLRCYIDSSIIYPDPCLNLSAPELNVSGNWSISPNPASGQFKITTSETNKSEFIIRNMLGEAVLHGQVREETIIDVSDLPHGMYSVSLISDGLIMGSQKLMVVE